MMKWGMLDETKSAHKILLENWAARHQRQKPGCKCHKILEQILKAYNVNRSELPEDRVMGWGLSNTVMKSGYNRRQRFQ